MTWMEPYLVTLASAMLGKNKKTGMEKSSCIYSHPKLSPCLFFVFELYLALVGGSFALFVWGEPVSRHSHANSCQSKFGERIRRPCSLSKPSNLFPSLLLCVRSFPCFPSLWYKSHSMPAHSFLTWHYSFSFHSFLYKMSMLRKAEIIAIFLWAERMTLKQKNIYIYKFYHLFDK